MSTFTPLARFRADLDRPDVIERLRDGLIGDGAPVDGPFGTTSLLYADYVASGRALEQVERFVMQEVLPYYANSHTEASFCGARMTRMRREARAEIARLVGADEAHAVVFGGSGATFWINRLVHLFDIPATLARGGRAVVLIGPYEHHSNILPWRESGAEVIEIPEARAGGPDMAALEAVLVRTAGAALRIGAFSAASNVTGIQTDTEAVTRLLKAHGALSVWDYAGGGPYLPVCMTPAADCAKDAVVFSPHKFIGGPAASGVMVLRRDSVARRTPVCPGGGTVRFVSPEGHDYACDLAAREESGTPDVIGDIRAGLAFLVKEALGTERVRQRHATLAARALAAWRRNPMIELLGFDRPALEAAPRLPFFSFRVRNGTGGYIHHQLFTRMLSDCHGIQARGGCACAGPYAHRLLGIDAEGSEVLRRRIMAGEELDKPGWVRLNFSALLTDEKAERIIRAVDALARNPHGLISRYAADPATARFAPVAAGEVA
ncbi:aminotransferase class V-fold PLP-dependent enzyme [Vannielia litorea]|uniref:Selenocysteine lyase/Cysteine desulfurase n=1 Tax=Vannielia litorea TaxID=1217970 RepID=A0A1N6GGK9_9RHOB|nr:aminotransferase class V-fold PLP-dependent enzyme [Vannielia litorea]SIO06653.1 Selenocysteine lyase/Cysteine desulfurase [Vannielia litorea]